MGHFLPVVGHRLHHGLGLPLLARLSLLLTLGCHVSSRADLLYLSLLLLVDGAEHWSEGGEGVGEVSQPLLQLPQPGLQGEGQLPLVVDRVNLTKFFMVSSDAVLTLPRCSKKTGQLVLGRAGGSSVVSRTGNHQAFTTAIIAGSLSAQPISEEVTVTRLAGPGGQFHGQDLQSEKIL